MEREFRTFVEQTEKELWQLFKSIDRDHNGQLDKAELKLAFVRAGLSVPDAKLDQFFGEVNTNHDGVISFDEWRQGNVMRKCFGFVLLTFVAGTSYSSFLQTHQIFALSCHTIHPQ